MHGEEELGLIRPSSVPTFPFGGSTLGCLHKDQSYLGREIDPENVSRVRAALDKYKGPRNLAEHEAIISKKAELKQRKTRETAAEYKTYLATMKAEIVPVFQFADDPRKGMPTQDEYIAKKVKAGIREMRDKTVDYKAWVEDLRVKQQKKMREKLAEKQGADAAFEGAAVARDIERQRRDQEIRDQVKNTEDAYWKYLRKMKNEVAMRPNSAPVATESGCESPEAMAAKRKKAMAEVMTARNAEYREWLTGVQNKEGFQLPPPVCNHEDQLRRAEVAKQKVKEMKQEQHEYFVGVEQMRQKHHVRIMKVVQKRDEADAVFNRDMSNRGAALEIKMAAEKEKQRAVSDKGKQELVDMYARVRARPLHIEKQYEGK